MPNLEIETGEIVGAGHASATGRFDDEQLFYLQSRGIPRSEARRLVVRGFFADLISKIGVPELEERLIDARSRRSWRRTSTGSCDDVPAGLRARATSPTAPPLRVEVDGLDVAVVHSDDDEFYAIHDECTHAASPCPRARSTAARSSAGCTARASTCAPASPTGLPATEPVPIYPVKIDGDDVLDRPHKESN